MPLPKNKEARARIAKAVVALMKLPPAQRKRMLHDEMDKRGLQSILDSNIGNQQPATMAAMHPPSPPEIESLKQEDKSDSQRI